MMSRLKSSLVILIASIFYGCASLPPGSDFPKIASSALAHPETTRLGRQFENAVQEHQGNSGFRIIPAGIDGLRIRLQMVNAAEQTLDLQYFIFHEDETGTLLTDAVLRAADRGVRVRVLVDDAEMRAGDDRIMALDAHPMIEIRIFNPFADRSYNALFRSVEFMFNASRLDYRMHNKLLVVDNAIALIGGRNIGKQFFQIDPESQFADNDLFIAGPITRQLSMSFDEFWNSMLSIPATALSAESASLTALHKYRNILNEHSRQLQVEGLDFMTRAATGEPFDAIISGRLPLIWAHAQLVYDSPDKKKVEHGHMLGKLMHKAINNVAMEVQSELLVATPFLVPGEEGLQFFKNLRQRNVRVRILTNSLQSSPLLLAQSAYMHYRIPLLEAGVELYETRAHLGSAKGSGEAEITSRYGNYALHAKLFVFDRQKSFIGSMNFDQRSEYLNTEIGLIIDSPILAQQVAARFEAMVLPVNAYMPVLRDNGAGKAPNLIWLTQEGDEIVEYQMEPARSEWQRIYADMLTLLPLDEEL